MATDTLTGSRIRDRRVMAGQKQADLARQIGISASYLNLIEHNRRRIGGKLLLQIASVLGVEPNMLTEGAEAALIATLREAADKVGLAEQEADRADEFAGRFPGWAEVLATTRRRVVALEQTVEALTDRLAHDPHLAASMHELLSTAAAIRSTASILADDDAIEPAWRKRFHANINEDSRRLADSAQDLINSLEADQRADDAVNSPQEEVEQFLAEHGFRFPSLEHGGEEAAVDALLDQASTLRTPAARHIAQGVLLQVMRDAAVLPLDKLEEAVSELGPDPAALARHLHQAPARVLRRLAALPGLKAGLVVCDRSGAVIFRKSVDGFTVPQHGSCCPLWPLFSALGQPGTLVSETVNQLGRAQAHFTAYATCESQSVPDYNVPPLVQSVMLLLPLAAGGASSLDVGSTCRVCPNPVCKARREPSILGGTT